MNDNNYIFSNTPQHVYIDGCTGISFLGCQFNNDNSVVMFNKKSMGIKSMNSNFIVNNGTSFNNLYRAIDARSTGVPISFTVANSTFTNNQTGIYTSYVNNFNLLLNTFNVGGNQMTGATVQLGIQNMYGTGFTIEENHFNKSYNPAYNPSKFGIASYQTGTSSNQIYKNTFNEVNFGNYAWGINRSSTNPNFQGLQYLCNENTQNVNYDFYIYTSGETTWDGIRLNQGSLQSPARNTFSVGGVNQGNDIYNFSPAQLSYYYQTGNTQQTPVSTYKVTTIPISGSETCPSNLCDPPCALRPLDEVELSQLYMEYDSAETAYLNLLYTYNTLMDGGSTNNLLTQIQQTWSTEATTLRDELLLLSPYVSQEVLRDVAGTGILPPAMLLVVCMANPDATRSEDFLDYLQYDIPSPLPSYMIAAIETTWDVGTSRTVMENTLGDYNEKMALVSNKILSDLNYKNNQTIEESNPGDTTNISQQINYWLNRIQTLEAKYEMAEHYFEEGSYALAEDVLLSIPLCYRLTEAEQQTLTSYNYIYQYRKNLLDSGKTLSMLDSSQINELILFANNNANIAGSIAENALCFYYDICTQDNYDTTGTGNNRQMRNTNIPAAHFQEVQDVVACRVMVLPNPATDKATFQYSINSLKDKPEFEIRDMTGREIMKVRITEKEGVIEWQTVVVKSGMYYFSIKAGSKTLARGKLTVRK